ncbi:hypothetical protein ACQ4PT_009109 [Festuca glaucescens]
MDRARANYIISKATRRMTTQSEGGASIPTYLGDAVDSLEYVVTLGIGTPAVQQTVLIDTGSDLSFDGLLGLGGAPESLVSQYGGAFSYCLPPTNSSAGFLTLSPPSNNTAGFMFTPMYRYAPDIATFYLVTLTGISVGGKPLDIAPSVFAGGLIIDSGTVITGLPKTAYAALRTAFRSAMSQYPLVPSDTGLDTCYNFTGHSDVVVPKVALTFNGSATIEIDVPSGVLVESCLAFVAEGRDGGVGIIGNVNQRTFEVLYDSRQGTVGFRAGAC